MSRKVWIIFVTFVILNLPAFSQPENSGAVASEPVREHLLMDFGWRFAFGHACDAEKDHKHGTDYFSYLAKIGWAQAGPAAVGFDDSHWRPLDLPHDWAVELPFDARGGHSHGYRAMGRNFPDNNVGWYRKTFFIDEADHGKRISLQFDGVFRNSAVWVNGFYCGTEPSGYSEFRYDITDYLNYGGDNVVAVRVDATMEEGWFYEGAGIYRHVWLDKTGPVHVEPNGIFVTCEVDRDRARVTVHTAVLNEDPADAVIGIEHRIVDQSGHPVASKKTGTLSVKKHGRLDLPCELTVKDPEIWSIETPVLYRLITRITRDKRVTDRVETGFGIRTIRFDPDNGFFLNGRHVWIQGTNNHQDHAGVGTAIPDALQEYRIMRLKDMGCNAYRCAHNPPAPELLDACDRLGMLVLDENRLMGSTPQILRHLETLIRRDRNHPCVIAWSIGNEEWGIEGNVKGARIAATMQAFARQFDDTRPFTVASSGGWGQGVSVPIELMGFNYLRHGNIDAYHKQFPDRPAWGTEETTTQGTRGIYADDRAHGHMAPTDRTGRGGHIETGLKYYAERPFLAGLFFWTGFDYRGESNPLNFPAVSSQYGPLDACGFFKDPAYYLKAWWTEEPVLDITPHWTWPGSEGDSIAVWVQSNCEEVGLFLNGKNLGRKTMEKYGHLEWSVPYEPGILLAEGYGDGERIITYQMKTAGKPAELEMATCGDLSADGEDVSVITVRVLDSEGKFVPTANVPVSFSVDGPGKIIGVGNGDPACHEPDKVFDRYEYVKIHDLKIRQVPDAAGRPEVRADFDDSDWRTHEFQREQIVYPPDTTVVIRGTFDLPSFTEDVMFTLFAKSMCMDQAVYINGHRIAGHVGREAPGQVYRLDNAMLHPGLNSYAVIGPPLQKRQQWEELNTDPGIIQMITPRPPWKRSSFNGLAQVIVQASTDPGDIIVTAGADGLKSAALRIRSEKTVPRPAVR
ncbi:DUF4982 domain-containing protein [bacterium]|nr:DUF4982 domain-containing protein [bacterium]